MDDDASAVGVPDRGQRGGDLRPEAFQAFEIDGARGRNGVGSCLPHCADRRPLSRARLGEQGHVNELDRDLHWRVGFQLAVLS